MLIWLLHFSIRQVQPQPHFEPQHKDITAKCRRRKLNFIKLVIKQFFNGPKKK